MEYRVLKDQIKDLIDERREEVDKDMYVHISPLATSYRNTDRRGRWKEGMSISMDVQDGLFTRIEVWPDDKPEYICYRRFMSKHFDELSTRITNDLEEVIDLLFEAVGT